jgi:hypothetical protein
MTGRGEPRRRHDVIEYFAIKTANEGIIAD